MNALYYLVRDRTGASASEFALILPVALLFLLGIIDVGRYAWVLNEYEKATQMGARYAIATNVVATGLTTQSYVGATTCGAALKPGDRICAAALSPMTCTKGAANCVCSGNCPTDTSRDLVALQAIIDRMRNFAPQLSEDAVEVRYAGSGIGYAGDPDKPEVAPFVTVRVADAQYTPIALSPLDLSVPLPDFTYTLTLEDGKGAVAY